MTIAALTYHVHDGCPPATVFVEQVRARTSNIDFQDARGAVTVAIGVEIVRSEDQSVGKLTIVSGATQHTERELASATCPELVRALALSAAMNLDPSLADAIDPVPQPSPQARPPVSVLPALATQTETSAPLDNRSVQAPEPQRASATSLGADVDGDFFFGQASAPGIALFLDHIYEGHTQPSWRIGFHGSRAVVTSGQGSIDLYWLTARLAGSLIRFHLGDVDLVPSAMVEGGFFAGHGTPIALQSRSDATGWLATGIGVRLERRFLPRWAVEVDVAALLPLFRREAAFQGAPTSSIFVTPPVAVSAGAGVRYVFP